MPNEHDRYIRRLTDEQIQEDIDYIYKVSGPDDADCAGVVASDLIREKQRRAAMTAHERIALSRSLVEVRKNLTTSRRSPPTRTDIPTDPLGVEP